MTTILKTCDFPPLPPAGLLGLEEALFGLVQADPQCGILWFWESGQPFVVVGYGQKVGAEVRRDACERRGIPVLRRWTGGGAVVQGPGCLSYGLALPIAMAPELASVTGANAWIMERQRRALAGIAAGDVSVRGHTDLTVNGRKISGNAQRRGREAVLFHGTFLLQADTGLMADVLRHPSSEPAYRAGRAHEDFVAGLDVPGETIKRALRSEWNATLEWTEIPVAAARQAAEARYSQASWNLLRP